MRVCVFFGCQASLYAGWLECLQSPGSNPLWTIRDAWTEGDSIGQGERSELKVEQIMHDFKLFGSLKIGEAREIIISPKQNTAKDAIA